MFNIAMYSPWVVQGCQSHHGTHVYSERGLTSSTVMGDRLTMTTMYTLIGALLEMKRKSRARCSHLCMHKRSSRRASVGCLSNNTTHYVQWEGF